MKGRTPRVESCLNLRYCVSGLPVLQILGCLGVLRGNPLFRGNEVLTSLRRQPTSPDSRGSLGAKHPYFLDRHLSLHSGRSATNGCHRTSSVWFVVA